MGKHGVRIAVAFVLPPTSLETVLHRFQVPQNSRVALHVRCILAAFHRPHLGPKLPQGAPHALYLKLVIARRLQGLNEKGPSSAIAKGHILICLYQTHRVYDQQIVAHSALRSSFNVSMGHPVRASQSLISEMIASRFTGS